MKQFAATVALLVLTSAALRADVTVSTDVTIDGPMAAMLNGSMPRMTMRIKGQKARTDMEFMGQTVATLVDLDTRQMIVLMPAQKTAQVIDPTKMAAAAAATGGVPSVPKFESTFQPTGRTQVISGRNCDQFTFAASVELSQMAGFGSQIPKDAAEMLKDAKVVTKGAIWVDRSGPGVSEYQAFQKKAVAANLGAAAIGAAGGAPGLGNLDQAMRLFAQADGIPFLAETEITLEGSAPILEMIKQMATMKVTNKVTEVSVAAIADDLFAVPADYTVTNP